MYIYIYLIVVNQLLLRVQLAQRVEALLGEQTRIPAHTTLWKTRIPARTTTTTSRVRRLLLIIIVSACTTTTSRVIKLLLIIVGPPPPPPVVWLLIIAASACSSSSSNRAIHLMFLVTLGNEWKRNERYRGSCQFCYEPVPPPCLCTYICPHRQRCSSVCTYTY